MGKRSVMILDGNTRQTLALARAFGRRGIKVIIGGYSRLSRALYSKYCAGFFLYPAAGNSTDMHRVILNNVKRFKPDVLMPVLDRTYSIILSNIEDYKVCTHIIPLPDLDTFMMMLDKQKVVEFALKSDVAVPKTLFYSGAGDIEKISREVEYPVVVKPRFSCGGYGMCIAESAQDLKTKSIEMAEKYNSKNMPPEIFFNNSSCLIQEHVKGAVVNFIAYCQDSIPVASIMAETLANYPLPFGPALSVRNIKNDAVKDISFKLCRLLRWNGLIGFEYIISDADNTPQLIDVHPRIYGSIEHALVSGIDFPDMLFKKALNEEFELPSDYEEGREFQWLITGKLINSFKTGAWFELIKYYYNRRHVPNEVLCSDLMPHLIHVACLLKSGKDMR
jgi:predicted ATP-grasp superfamily ATP-dependent carboligase